MNNDFTRIRSSRRFHSGVATLPISLILLVLLTLITVYAARVGIVETRTSANKQRAEQAFSVSEALVEQGMQFLNTNRSLILSTATGGWMNTGSTRHWETCPASNSQLPCSSASDRTSWLVVQNLPTLALNNCTDIDSDDTGAVDNIPNGKCDSDSTTFSNANGATLYLHVMTRCKDSNNDGTCDSSTPNDYPVISVVGGGNSADGTALAQIAQAVHFYDAFPGAANAFAPLVASGSVVGSGNFSIVGNPDTGANDSNSIGSNKLAVWSGSNVVVGSASGTCKEGNLSLTGYLSGASTANVAGATVHDSVQDYYDYYASNPNGSHPQVDIIKGYYSNGEALYLCKSCTCPTTYTSTNGAVTTSDTATVEDDILDIEATAVGRWANTIFPDDVFLLFTTYPESAYLTFKSIIAGMQDKVRVLNNCDALDTTSSGWYWIEGNCIRGASQGDIGSPINRGSTKIIVNGNLEVKSNVYIWGSILVFSPPSGSPATYAARTIKLSGTPTFYGSLLSNTDVDFSGGTYKSRYVPDPTGVTVPTDTKWGFAKLPGSWRDY